MFVIQILSVCFPMQFNLELWRHQNNLCNAAAGCFFLLNNYIEIYKTVPSYSTIYLFLQFMKFRRNSIKHIKKWSRQHFVYLSMSMLNVEVVYVEKPQLKITNKKRFWKAGILVKENVIPNTSFPTCKDDNARLRILPLTFVSDQIWIKKHFWILCKSYLRISTAGTHLVLIRIIQC